MNLEQKNQLLKEPSSNYYCGSACLLSLSVLLGTIKDGMTDFDKAFPDFEKNVLSLCEKDGELFSLSGKKNLLSDEEWKEINDILYLYGEVIDDLGQLILLCQSSHKERFLPLLERHLSFLSSLAKDNLNVLSERKDVVESFYRMRNDVLLSMERKNTYE